MSKRDFYLLAGLFLAGFICGLVLLFRQPARSNATLGRISSSFLGQNTVVVVDLYGPIYISESSSAFSFMDGADRIVRRLRRLSKQSGVKAVVLRINSPGGSVAATQEICQEINHLRKSGKIVVASLGDIAASGGYYAASQADLIVASSGTLTGSIGVILEVANVQELFRKVGLKVETIRTGAYKDIASPFRELTAGERKLLQGLIDDAYGQFVDAVASGRKLDRDKVLAVADGRIFTGTQAYRLGLIDGFADSEEAILLAAKRAGIENPNVVYDRDSESLGQLFRFFGDDSATRFMSRLMARRKIRLDYMLE